MKSAASVFFLSLTVFLINGRPHPEVDCVAAPYVAWSLVRHGTYDVRHYSDLERYRYAGGPIRGLPDGSWLSIRPPGSALAAVPFVAPIALIRDQPLRDHDMHHVGKLVAAVSVAGAAVFFFFTCRCLAPAGAWPATILFAFGTCLYSVASQALWMHGPATFWLCAALYLLTCHARHERLSGLAGFALGLAVLTRPTAAFFALATVGASASDCEWRRAGWLIVGGVIPAILLLHYNWVYFGQVFLSGYDYENLRMSVPLWLGLGGLLVAPSRGVLVYSPALLLALWGIRPLVRGELTTSPGTRRLLVTWTLAAGVTLLSFGRWHGWAGGWSYGPRVLAETMPVLCLLFAMAYTTLLHRWQRRHALPDQGRSLFDLSDTQIEAHARALVQKLARQGP